MKKQFYVLLVALTLGSIFSSYAQVVFFADFESQNKPINKAGSYKGPAGTKWENSDFLAAGGGKKGLKQAAEGCGISGNTKLPGVTKFTDGVIQCIFSFGDDDGFGVTFRKKGDDKGYLVAFGYNETTQVIIGDYANGCCPDLQCLDQCGCENGGKELLGVDHGLGGGLPQDNKTAMLGRVEVQGQKIRVWYKKLSDVKGFKVDMPSNKLGKPVAEYNKANYQSAGSVGIWHERWGQGIVDSILVTGPGFFSVDPEEKLTTSWGFVKATY